MMKSESTSGSNSQVQFIGYEVLKFHFEQDASGEKEGWNFYPDVRIAVLKDGTLRGEVLLSANAFLEFKGGKRCAIAVLWRGFFQSLNMTQEELKQYCLVKGSAYLISPLRTFVNDFLENVRKISHDAL
ncbi:MAG: hypothetical protein ABDK94_00365 [Atribacterota bacterium]